MALCGDDSRTESTITTTEHLTPDSSFFSLDLFNMTVEDFPSQQTPAEPWRVRSILALFSNGKEPSEISRVSRNKLQKLGAQRSDTSPLPLPRKEECLRADIGDEPGHRVDIHYTPSLVSLLSADFLGIAYLSDGGGSCDAGSSYGSSSCGSGWSGQHE